MNTIRFACRPGYPMGVLAVALLGCCVVGAQSSEKAKPAPAKAAKPPSSAAGHGASAAGHGPAAAGGLMAQRPRGMVRQRREAVMAQRRRRMVRQQREAVRDAPVRATNQTRLEAMTRQVGRREAPRLRQAGPEKQVPSPREAAR